MPDDLIQIDEYIVTEQIIDFVLACVVARAQAPNSAHFVGGVMIDVHRWIFLPALKHPVDESLNATFSSSRSCAHQSRNSNRSVVSFRAQVPNRFSNPPGTNGYPSMSKKTSAASVGGSIARPTGSPFGPLCGRTS